MTEFEEINLFLKDATLYIQSLKIIYKSHKHMLSEDFLDKVNFINGFLLDSDFFGDKPIYFYAQLIDNDERYLYCYSRYGNTTYLHSCVDKTNEYMRSLILRKIICKEEDDMTVIPMKYNYECLYKKKSECDIIKNDIRNTKINLIINREIDIIRYLPSNKLEVYDDLFKYVDSCTHKIKEHVKTFVFPFITEVCYVVDVGCIIFDYYL